MIKALSIKSKNKRKSGNSIFIYGMVWITISIFTMIMITDLFVYFNMNIKSKQIINRAVKACALQLDTTSTNASGENLSAKGIFLIDEVKGTEEFLNILKLNFDLDDNLEPKSESLVKSKIDILEYKIFNDYMNMPYEYMSPLMQINYYIKRPCVLAVVKIHIESSIGEREIIIGKLSAAELINKNDL